MRKFTATTIDSAIEALIPRDFDEMVREAVERAIGRVVGQNADIADLDIDEIADRVVIEEFQKLSAEEESAVDNAIVEGAADALTERIREEVRSRLRG